MIKQADGFAREVEKEKNLSVLYARLDGSLDISFDLVSTETRTITTKEHIRVLI